MKFTLLFSAIVLIGILLLSAFFIVKNMLETKTPKPTIQYSNPIGPTQTPPYQLESKSLISSEVK